MQNTRQQDHHNKNLIRRNSVLLVIAAMIWGGAFVAQSTGGDAVGPYTFNCVRSLIASIVLIPVILLSDHMHWTRNKPKTREDKKKLLIAGISCGIALSIASNLQQVGIWMGTSVGKAGFLTACYMLLVPILGLFIKRKCGWNVWLGVAIAVVGLYLLCMQGSFYMQLSDVLVLMCALSFAVQILVVDRYVDAVDGVRLSCIQFIVSGVISAVPMIFIDMGLTVPRISEWASAFADLHAWIPILYAGVLSSGVAFTLQIIGQRGMNPTVASLLMSLESVFSALAGWLILKQTLSVREIFGCLLIFGAVVLAQLQMQKKHV